MIRLRPTRSLASLPTPVAPSPAAPGRRGLGLALGALVVATACPALALPTTANPVLFVTQVPVGNFTTVTAVFGNHVASVGQAPRGGDLVLRYPDGTLRLLTAEAGYGNDGFQGAGAIAVREPCVHWSGTKALFSMVVGAATQQYQTGSYRWQIYEVSGLAPGQTATIRYIDGQPADYNNVSPIYGTDDRILFTSDRPTTGQAHHWPQREEYESAPIVAGIYSLMEDTGELTVLEHAPSGATSLSMDSFGRVIFTKWDHLQRDQQGDAPDTAASYKAFTWADESAQAATTTSLIGAEVFPEPRTMNDPAYSPQLALHPFNHFLPWEMNQDGTAEETLNHVGRQELGGSYSDGSFVADPNLSYFTPPSTHANTLYIAGSAGLFHLREDPTSPGDFFTTYAQEFGTASGGTLMHLTGAPSVNPEDMLLTAVTPGSADAQVPADTGWFRNPLPMSDGQLLAVHTAASGYVANEGSTAAPAWNYAYRIKELNAADGFYAAGAELTAGITKNLSWWTPDQMATWSGVLWELDPVEVVARAVPAARTSELPAVEAAIFAAACVDVEEFRQFLRDSELALLVGRNVTQRDRADVQQPFNLAVPGGVASIAKPGTVYETAFLQIFQADLLRGYGDPASPQPGRRVLARPMHGDAVSPTPVGGPEGSVAVAADGSFAALVPARRALSWQLTDTTGQGVVRERNWISFQSGEIRVCASCHGVNTQSQTGDANPTNPPQALAALLAEWAGDASGPCDQACEATLAAPRWKLKPGKWSLSALLPPGALAEDWDPAADGLALAIGEIVDATLAPGAAWKGRPERRRYRDEGGAASGVVAAVVVRAGDGSGATRIKVQGKGTLATPDPTGLLVRVEAASGGPCAEATWNGPAQPRPRCEPIGNGLLCR